MVLHRVAEIHVEDIGTELRVQVFDETNSTVDLTSASSLELRAKKPDGTVVDWTATGGSTADPTKTARLGWLHYLTLADDLDQDGHWKLQPKITIGSGTWRADIHDILVHANL